MKRGRGPQAPLPEGEESAGEVEDLMLFGEEDR
jgi:hypothetical protein